MGAGFSRINGLTVIQTSQGLAGYLGSLVPNAAQQGVVLGYDGRHNSKKYAQLAATAFDRKGFRVWWFGQFVHTPLVPFTVRQVGAAGGVMITASHNPAQDNGYKVYAENGCQIVSPADKMIAEAISENLPPLSWKLSEPTSVFVDVHIKMSEAYQTVVTKYLNSGSCIRFPAFIYTPMHGVGLPYFRDMLKALRISEQSASGTSALESMVVVSEQATPDPDFPTVRFPNPEESGALDVAKSYADQRDINVIIANDPDADRFAAAEKIDGQWYQFTGDQVGVLLGYYILTHIQHPISKSDVMLNSAVSSSMLAHIASREGFTVEETLTGFKWLGNRALTISEQGGKHVRFAYEEALGYMFPSVVYDKDGIVAAGVFLKACAEWGSLYVKLRTLYQEYGWFETMNTYWRSPDTATTLKVFKEIQGRFSKETKETLHLGSRKCIRWRDLSTGFDSGAHNDKAALPSSPDTLMITCWLDGSDANERARFTVRASGTEPKIKGACLLIKRPNSFSNNSLV